MTRALWIGRFGWTPLLLLLASCEPGGPEFVYIPGPGFDQTLVTRADLDPSGTARTGEWITLHANRLLGPWQRVRKEEAQDAPCRRVQVPPGPELEIASKIRWRVEPEAGFGFNVPGPPDYERQIRFDRPGRFVIRGVSEGCGSEILSPPIEVVVQ